MIIVDEIRITNGMKEIMVGWQDEKYALLDADIEAIENAVCFIASEHECPKEDNEKEALTIIAELSYLRKKLKRFYGRRCDD